MGALPPVDVLLSPSSQANGAVLPAEPGMELTIPLAPVRLVDLCETPRMRNLDRLESYYRLTQDAAKLYDWNGYFYGYGAEAPIKPGWFVPYSKRRPSARYHIARMVVRRLTSLLFGKDRFPEITVQGSEDDEDYARALVDESRLKLRMIEGRNLGGAMGTACFSFAFVEGKPRVEVHNAKHCTVLRWANENDHRPAAVLSAYSYPRQVWDPQAQRMRELRYYAVRYWDETIEATWDPIPAKVAETIGWMNAVPRRVTAHAFGFCPFYWVQNVADSCEPDGEGDYEGFEGDFDEINQLLSAVSKGTKSNVDPTLVIKMDPSRNTGNVQKGSENAIFSEGGAEYLELKGQAVQAAVQLLERERAYTLDALGVVVADPEKMAGSAQSGRALEILYAPMLALCDLLREQYGTFGVKPIVRDMMRAARILAARGETVVLPPRVETKKPAPPKPGEPPAPPEEHEEVVVVERKPGTSDVEITLSWNPYFPPTWEDITKAVTSAQTASGGKPVISQRTAVSTVASLFGVQNVDAELAAIHQDGERALETAQRAFEAEGGGGPKVPLEGDDKPKGEDDDEE